MSQTYFSINEDNGGIRDVPMWLFVNSNCWYETITKGVDDSRDATFEVPIKSWVVNCSSLTIKHSMNVMS